MEMCACCSTMLDGSSSTTLDGQVFCDDGCAVSYHRMGSKPVREWPSED